MEKEEKTDQWLICSACGRASQQNKLTQWRSGEEHRKFLWGYTCPLCGTLGDVSEWIETTEVHTN